MGKSWVWSRSSFSSWCWWIASSTARGCSPNSSDTAARSSWSGTHRSSQTTVPASARRSEISATGKPSASRTPLRYTGSVPYTTAYPSRHPPRAHGEQGQMSAPAAQFEGELEQPCLPFLILSRIWWLPRLGVATGSCADVLQLRTSARPPNGNLDGHSMVTPNVPAVPSMQSHPSKEPPMPAPNASYSITMRVHLDTDPRGIGRITTAVGEAAGTVTAVDVVES